MYNISLSMKENLFFQISGILATLRRELSRGEVHGNNLESLMAQCVFFGQSMSRVGGDFRGLVPAVFQVCCSSEHYRL